MYLNTVKKIAAGVLYIDDPSELADEQPLGERGFSSIDYIDLCFELKTQVSEKITPDNLWPFNAMLAKQEYFDGSTWTKAGWDKVCEVLEIEQASSPIVPRDLVRFFTPAVLSKRVTQILNG